MRSSASIKSKRGYSMQWWDFVLLALSVGSTIFSLIGAYKSNAYYKKSKQLTMYAGTNSAFIESQKIISTMTQMLKLASSNKRRGKDYASEIGLCGESIKTAINRIRETMPVKDFIEINDLLRSQEPRVEEYIDSFITGAVLVEEKLVIGDDFNRCHQIFCDMQLLIRQKIERIAEELK